jgi:hypothetical protein
VQPIALWTFLTLAIEVADVDRNISKFFDINDTRRTFTYVELGGPEKMIKKFEDIKFTETTMPKGIQALIAFGEYELSIICNEGSYGGKNGGTLYEIGVFKNNKMVELPGITEPNDTVKGWLNEDKVMATIKKMHLISGADPVAV